VAVAPGDQQGAELVAPVVVEAGEERVFGLVLRVGGAAELQGARWRGLRLCVVCASRRRRIAS
jgi:hypothetical protein